MEEALKIVRDLGGIPVAVTVIVDRSGGAPDFGAPFHELGRIDFPNLRRGIGATRFSSHSDH